MPLPFYHQFTNATITIVCMEHLVFICGGVLLFTLMTLLLIILLLSNTSFATDQGCVDVSIAVGSAVVVSFVGGVLLTAVIASGIAGAVVYRAKKKVSHKME